jgi:hypothetical protein
MAYATTNPPVRVTVGALDGNAPAVWVYKSADAVATVKGSKYFSNGSSLGMIVGDFVLVSDTATPLGTLTVVSAVASDGATVV